MTSLSTLPSILDIAPEEFERQFAEWGASPYRIRQIYQWVFDRHAQSFAEMTDLPAALREKLAQTFQVCSLRLVSKRTSRKDGTRRYTFETQEGRRFSTVFLPEKEHIALCLSTQVGCAYRCTFCASGLVKFKRNLKASEILEQILWVWKDAGVKPATLLFMGMGEPLANYAELVRSIRWITAPMGLGMSPSRITVSTSGLVPQIQRLAEEKVRVALAVSLHAVHDDLRKALMPVSAQWSVRELIKSARTYARSSRSPVTFEYLLLAGVNDQEQDANRLSYLIRGFPSKVNLIPYNPVAGLPYRTPRSEEVHRFQAWLRQRGVHVFVRKAKGVDIGSGCGQLGPGTSHHPELVEGCKPVRMVRQAHHD